MTSQYKGTFIWTGEHQEVFDVLKTHLTSAPVLGYPDFSQPFELETDASVQGLGTVLTQRDENGTSCVMPVSPCGQVNNLYKIIAQQNWNY